MTRCGGVSVLKPLEGGVLGAVAPDTEDRMTGRDLRSGQLNVVVLGVMLRY